MTESKDGTTMDLQHWKEYFADAVEMWPGVKVDRELMHALSLPKKQQEKRVKEIKAQRAAAAAAKAKG